MLKLSFLAYLGLISTIVKADCSFTEANFSDMGASEFSYTLILTANGEAKLVHEYWQPGNANNIEATDYKGTWTCENAKVTLNFTTFSEVGRYQNIGENPLGVHVDTKVLVIESSQGLLSNTVMKESDI